MSTNPASGDNGPPPTPRQEFLNFLNNTLPNVNHNVAVDSLYDELRIGFGNIEQDIMAFINHNLGTLNIVLGTDAEWVLDGVGADTLTLPGDNRRGATDGMDDYVQAIGADRWPNHRPVDMYAGMIPQNTR